MNTDVEQIMNNVELLNKAVEYGIIDLEITQQILDMNERTRFLQMHDKKIWQGTNGFWYTRLNNKLIKKKEREKLDDVIVAFYKQDEPTIRNCFDGWIAMKLEWGEIKKSTRDRYIRDFDRYFADISERKIRFIDEIALESYIKSTIKKENLTTKNWENFRILINGIWKYAKKINATELSISSFMGDLMLSRNTFKRKMILDEEQVFTDDEISLLTKYAESRPTDILAQGVLLALQTGMRSGEVCTLKYSDMDGDILHICRTETSYNDNGKYIYKVEEATKGTVGYRNAVLLDNAKATIELLHSLNPNGVYLLERNGKRIKMRSFTTKLYAMCDAVNISRRSMHKLRKTYGSTLLNAGVPEPLVKNQMGHTLITTTKAHYWYRNTTIEQDKEILSNVFEVTKK